MINKKVVEVVVENQEVVSKVCDKCKKEYIKENDIFEFREFHHIRFMGGYGSIFGDDDCIEVDLCQHCLYDLVKDFYRIEENN